MKVHLRWFGGMSSEYTPCHNSLFGEKYGKYMSLTRKDVVTLTGDMITLSMRVVDLLPPKTGGENRRRIFLFGRFTRGQVSSPQTKSKAPYANRH